MRTRSLEATVIPSCCLPCGVCVQIIRGGYCVLLIPLGINAAASRLTNFIFSTRGSFYRHLKIHSLRHYQIVHMCWARVFLILLNKSIVPALYWKQLTFDRSSCVMTCHKEISISPFFAPLPVQPDYYTTYIFVAMSRICRGAKSMKTRHLSVKLQWLLRYLLQSHPK